LREVELVDKLVSIGLCVIIASDRKESFMRLDPATRVSFTLMCIPKYSASQVFDIIKERAEQALKRGSYSDEVIRKIAEISNGDVSLAINMLKTASLKAESENRTKIKVNDIPRSDCPRLELSYDERVLLNILEQFISLPASKLYEIYLQEARYLKCERSFRKYMEKLCSKGFVKAIGDKRGRVYEVVAHV